ncbi:MAG: alpha/beta fold hydrolase [Gammaproteobacteria bacterium]
MKTHSFLSRKIKFPGAYRNNLTANLMLPHTTPVAFALFVHCFSCKQDSLAAESISRSLIEEGIAVLRFDFTGLGISEGDYANANFSANSADIMKAVEFLKINYEAPKILIGHSLGAVAVAAIAHELPEVTALVLMSAPNSVGALKSIMNHSVLMEASENGQAEIELGSCTFSVRQELIRELTENSVANRIKEFGRPLLVMHSVVDKVVHIDNAYTIFSSATSGQNFISLNQADHFLLGRNDAKYASIMLANWVLPYSQKEPGTVLAKIEAITHQVVVHETRRGLFLQNIEIGTHTLMADEPIEAGGNDYGPNPYDLLLAGLGACTSMTLRLYANLKQMPLDRISVKLNHKKKYYKDCENVEKENAKLDFIEVDVVVYGDLTNDQRMRLLDIAKKCPVHKTLMSKISIDTHIKQA